MFFPQRRQSFEFAPAASLQWEQTSIADPLAVDLTTVKNFLNIPLEDNYFNDEKMQMVAAAQAAIEQNCQMTLVESTWTASLPAFYDTIRLVMRPFISVEEVSYVAAETGEITVLPTDQYGWGRMPQKCGFVTRGEEATWPQTARRWDAVRIKVKAGFEELPAPLLQALLITTAALDKSRADDGASDRATNTVFGLKNQKAPTIIPPEAAALLSPWVYHTASFV